MGSYGCLIMCHVMDSIAYVLNFYINMTLLCPRGNYGRYKTQSIMADLALLLFVICAVAMHEDLEGLWLLHIAEGNHTGSGRRARTSSTCVF